METSYLISYRYQSAFTVYTDSPTANIRHDSTEIE